jgi:hypothetical protein
MEKKWLNILYSYGINEKDISNTSQQLFKKFGKEPNDNDIIWSLFNQVVLKTRDYQTLKMIYYEMALFLNEEGKDFFHVLQQSKRMELIVYKQRGVKKVEILAASNSCEHCQKLNGKILTINEALEEMFIPCEECTHIISVAHRGFCRCCYVPIVEQSY